MRNFDDSDIYQDTTTGLNIRKTAEQWIADFCPPGTTFEQACKAFEAECAAGRLVKVTSD